MRFIFSPGLRQNHPFLLYSAGSSGTLGYQGRRSLRAITWKQRIYHTRAHEVLSHAVSLFQNACLFLNFRGLGLREQVGKFVDRADRIVLPQHTRWVRPRLAVAVLQKVRGSDRRLRVVLALFGGGPGKGTALGEARPRSAGGAADESGSYAAGSVAPPSSHRVRFPATKAREESPGGGRSGSLAEAE